MDARWTKKNAEVHYGYKNHVKADAKSKLLERYAVTDAGVPDWQKLAQSVVSVDGEVYADSAYRSAEAGQWKWESGVQRARAEVFEVERVAVDADVVEQPRREIALGGGWGDGNDLLVLVLRATRDLQCSPDDRAA